MKNKTLEQLGVIKDLAIGIAWWLTWDQVDRLLRKRDNSQ